MLPLGSLATVLLPLKLWLYFASIDLQTKRLTGKERKDSPSWWGVTGPGRQKEVALVSLNEAESVFGASVVPLDVSWYSVTQLGWQMDKSHRHSLRRP